MRRINFQTPGVCLSQVPGTTLMGNRKLPPGDPHLSRQAVLGAVQVLIPKFLNGSRLGTLQGWFYSRPNET